MRILYILILSVLIISSSFAQENKFTNIETRLSFIGELILSRLDDSTRLEANKQFSETLENVLQDPASFSYPFDQIPNLAVLTPEDSSFRIFNWNFPMPGPSFTFHALIQKKEGNHVNVYKLTDHSNQIFDPEHQQLNKDSWFGALYYQIIQKDFNGIKTYTLLGWDGHDAYSNKKVIEILSFENGTPLFGKRVFPDWGDQQQTRIIFEYSERTALSVRYDEQAILEKERKRKIVPGESMFNYTSIPAGMISFNRLEPMHPELEGDFRYYIARSELVDGLVFENGYWRYYPEVDARNRQMQDTTFQKPDDLNLMPDSIKLQR